MGLRMSTDVTRRDVSLAGECWRTRMPLLEQHRYFVEIPRCPFKPNQSSRAGCRRLRRARLFYAPPVIVAPGSFPACVCCPGIFLTGAAGIAFGAVAPANAQPIAGAKKPTPKKVGADYMQAKNFAPVVSPLNLIGRLRVTAVKHQASVRQVLSKCWPAPSTPPPTPTRHRTHVLIDFVRADHHL